MTDHKLSFVIVHFGDENLTKKAILSVKNNIENMSLERLIVVANGGCFPKENSDATILCLKENFGYAAGVNTGIRLAIERGASHVLVMNNDLEYQRGAAEALLAVADNFGLVGGTVREEYRLPVLGGGSVSWFRGRAHPNFGRGKIDYVSGAFFLVSRECFESVGPMPEKYFHTWEDVAYSFLARKRGWKIGYASTPEIVHLCSQSMGESKIKTYYLVRNGSIFIREFAPPFLKWWLLFIERPRLLWAFLRKRWEIVYALSDAKRGVSGKISSERDLSYRPVQLNGKKAVK